MANGRFYITTSIAYANAPPHIGFALESVQADVCARYYRARGAQVFFLTGTDEHGIKIVRAAHAAGKDPQKFVDEHAEAFKNLRETLNLSWDYFVRTSDRERHWPVAQEIWKKLDVAGDLYKKKYRGLYCAGHEAFITEKDMADGKCRDHQREPEIIEEENWFFRLSKYSKEIESKIKNDEIRIIPEGRKNEILSLLRGGLEDVSFSRPSKDVSWGVPVPNDPDYTMYVWCDALTNYLTGIGYVRDEAQFQKWWPADVHMIGKDIVRFHAAIWPAMLLSAGLPLPRSIVVHGFITVDGQKMSKTLGNSIDPAGLVEQYGADPVRYYLLREIPSREDGDFSYEKFKARYNGDLANGIGNLVSRIATLGEPVGNIEGAPANAIQQFCDGAQKKYDEHVGEFGFNDALVDVWEIVSFADAYINEKKPWILKERPEALKEVLLNAGYCVCMIAELLIPFLPETAEKIVQQIRYADGNLKIKKGASLFPRL